MSQIVVDSRNDLNIAVCADEAGSGKGEGNEVAGMHFGSCLGICEIEMRNEVNEKFR